jgi:6-phosphogluconolactonase
MTHTSKNTFRTFLLSAIVVLWAVSAIAQNSPKHYILYVGTYTTGESKGIYAYRYDAASGKLQSLGLAAGTENPSFLAVDAKNEHLYAVNETGNYKGKSTGGVTAFSIDRKNAKLAQLDEVASGGADPCYISLDRSGKYLLVANYTGGTVAVLPILPDGRVGEATSVVADEGTLGPNKERQEKPHAHWIEATARNRFVYVSDLGLVRCGQGYVEARRVERNRQRVFLRPTRSWNGASPCGVFSQWQIHVCSRRNGCHCDGLGQR